MRYLKAFGQFWYEFIVGDDPKIAIAVVAALAVVLGVLATGSMDDHALTVLGGIVIVGFFVISLVLDVRTKR